MHLNVFDDFDLDVQKVITRDPSSNMNIEPRIPPGGNPTASCPTWRGCDVFTQGCQITYENTCGNNCWFRANI